jgi:hypothetical protein
MKLSTLLSIVGVVGIVFGIGFVLLPAGLLSQYGVSADRYTIFMSRVYGVALIQVGLLLWLARHIADSLGRRAIVLSGLVAMVIGFVVVLRGQLDGIANGLGWSTVAIYGLFALGYAYIQFAPQKS